MPAKAGIQSKRTLCGLDSSFRWNDEQWNLGFPLSAGRFIVGRGEAEKLLQDFFHYPCGNIPIIPANLATTAARVFLSFHVRHPLQSFSMQSEFLQNPLPAKYQCMPVKSATPRRTHIIGKEILP